MKGILGVVNYYRDMWERRSHKLAIFTNITSGTVKFEWNKIKQDDFNEIKRIVSRNTFLACMGFNEEFKIRNNASDFQLRAVIRQKGKPIAFYSRKLTGAHTVTEKELLSIV